MIAVVTAKEFLAAIDLLKGTEAYEVGQQIEPFGLPTSVHPVLMATLHATSRPEPVIFLHEREAGTLTRVYLEDGHEEDFSFDVWSELTTMPDDGYKAVILFDSPVAGPEEGMVHFGVAAMLKNGQVTEGPLAIFDASG